MNEFDPVKLEKEIRMGMNLVDRNEFNATIRAVSHIAATTVQKTLGPYARTTIIDDGNSTHPTKDGWSILQRLRFQDPTHQSIFTMLKNISFRIVDKVGDGTTTAMVTADHFMDIFSNALETNKTLKSARQNEIMASLNAVRDRIVESLKTSAVPIVPSPDEENPSFDAIYNIALVSSNGNEQLAKIMQEIYQQTKNPNILVDMDGGKEISYEIQRGYRLDCATLMHERYINTTEHYYSTNHHPHMVFIFDHNVTYQRHAEMIDALTQYANRQGCFPIFMAPNFDDVITSFFSINIENQLKQYAAQGKTNVIPGMLVIQIPEMMRAIQKEYVNDFAALGGGNLINGTKVRLFMELRHNEKTDAEDEKIHDKLNDLDGYQFATAQEVINSCGFVITDAIIGKNFFTLQNLDQENPYYQSRYQSAKDAYDQARKNAENSPTSYTKELLDATQRLNKLSGALGVVHVGGVTDLERECNRDFVDDTFQACRSAYENGVVPGMNLGTLVCINGLRRVTSGLDHEVAEILFDAFSATTKDVLANKKPEINGRVSWNVEYAGGNPIRVRSTDALITTLIDEISSGKSTSYDMISESTDSSPIPKIGNSVATDIEILYGVISILGMILTSDQYLSVNRMYDKLAAIRQQEAINEKSTTKQINTILTTIDDYMTAHPDSKIGSLINNLLGK